MDYKSFNEVPIWKISVNLVEMIYQITEKFPPSERFILIDQLRRSSVSVAGNIAESWGRYHYADKIRVLYIARGEIEETRSHLAIAERMKYCSKDKYIEIDNNYKQLLYELNKYKKTLFNKSSNITH